MGLAHTESHGRQHAEKHALNPPPPFQDSNGHVPPPPCLYNPPAPGGGHLAQNTWEGAEEICSLGISPKRGARGVVVWVPKAALPPPGL